MKKRREQELEQERKRQLIIEAAKREMPEAFPNQQKRKPGMFGNLFGFIPRGG